VACYTGGIGILASSHMLTVNSPDPTRPYRTAITLLFSGGAEVSYVAAKPVAEFVHDGTLGLAWWQPARGP
jgi:hypothetical protein